jgi:cytochrome oxidase Cu insertion factor (SCO1/SenC/PrrC family)
MIPDRMEQPGRHIHCSVFFLASLGTQAEVDAAAKAYRVYYMKTDDTKDYLIDHSIIMVRYGVAWPCYGYYSNNFIMQVSS